LFFIRSPLFAFLCQVFPILPVNHAARFSAAFARLPPFADLACTTSREMTLDRINPEALFSVA